MNDAPQPDYEEFEDGDKELMRIRIALLKEITFSPTPTVYDTTPEQIIKVKTKL